MSLPRISNHALAFVFIVGMVNLIIAGADAGTAKAGHSIMHDKYAPQLPVDPGFENTATCNWWGERRRLADAGVLLNAQLVLEGFENFQGGRDTGTAASSTFDLNLTVNTGRAFDWQGGTFYMDVEDHAGKDPSSVLTGDLQGFDKLNSLPYFQIFELWYQQTLFDGWLRVKLGKIDANTEFSVIDDGLRFLNASTQVAPTILGFPTTPAPMPGVNLFFTPDKLWYAGFGAFYTDRSDIFGDFAGHPQSVQPTGFGTFLIGETGFRWQRSQGQGADGNLKLGIWDHTGTFTLLQGGTRKGSSGYYAVIDQTLWRQATKGRQGRGVRVFFESGRTQQAVSVIDWNVTGGINWTGILADRPDDSIGLSANYAHISALARLPHPYELALEGLYRIQVLRWAFLMPDLQFIVHPGGIYPDALVWTMDLIVRF